MRLLENEKNGDILVVKIFDDELNGAVADKFKQEIDEFISKGELRIALDMSKVKFMDSSGLGALISLLNKTKKEGALAVFGVKKMVLNLLTLTKTKKAFNLFNSRQEALDFLLK